LSIINKKKYDFYIKLLTVLFFIFINFVYFYLNLSTNLNDKVYSFQELFINYQAGFIRRGLLGELSWILYHQYSIEPKFFFSILFFVIYLTQFFLFFYLANKYIVSKIIFVLIFLSPALLLFHIYNPDLFFLRDSIIKLGLLLHAVIFYKYSYIDNNNKLYFKILKFLVVPIIFILNLIHEYQSFSISIHFLISLGAIQNTKQIKKLVLCYLPLIFSIILIMIFLGNKAQFYELSNLLLKFDIKLNPYLGGGLYSYVGSFYKWHFFYFSYRDFVNLFFSFILSVLVFFVLFKILIKKKILSFHSKFQKKYFVYFIPTLIPFLLATDHGRNLSFISFYLTVFYMLLKLDKTLLIKKKNLIFRDILNKYLILVFVFFYVFMWKLDQVAGFGLQGKPNDIFQSSLFAEIIKFIKFLYQFIDENLIKLPEIRL
jgi:hypothetical protein